MIADPTLLASSTVAAGGEQLPRADAALCQQHAGDGDHRELEQRDEHGVLGGDPHLRAPHRHALIVQLGKRCEDAAAFARDGARRRDRASAAKRVDEPPGDRPLQLE